MATSRSQPFAVINQLSAPVLGIFEPVGRWFESRDHHVRLLSGGSSVGEAGGGSEEEEEGRGSGEEDEEVNPLLLDPTQWKDQDHYSLLGLGKVRYQATQQDIRKAYRQMVLIHHPDKQISEAEGDDRFKCIKIAYDILSNQKRRRAFDSVDPTFDDAVPPNNAHSKDNFFTVFTPAFAENARWSSVQPVPVLGESDATFEEVNTFYSFWYDFESWREFSYLDEENLEKAESRDERRWMEKQNKTARLKKKKEETQRLRGLVDIGYALDPRIKRFKEEEKAEREARRRAKAEAVKQEALERERQQQLKADEEKRKREEEEEEARAQAAQVKKEKEVLKKALRREKKSFWTTCKSQNYFASVDGEVAGRMQDLEGLCDSLNWEQLKELNLKLRETSFEEGKTAVEEGLAVMRRKEEEAIASQARLAQAASSSSRDKDSSLRDWPKEQVQLLVKAVQLYPAGTSKRWEVIASFINSHSPDSCPQKTPKQVVNKVKALQKLETSERDRENTLAFQNFQKSHSSKGKVEAAPTEGSSLSTVPWTAEEQKLLEKALRSHPASVAGRWDKIASEVGSRSKTECVSRFKELVARVKAKKKDT